jgi:ADP-ribose pyrophosphatase YjhB (NUDIX family)
VWWPRAEYVPSPTPTCCACIVHQGRILLIQRAQEPNKGFWSFPGGHIELGETVLEAAHREVREETGVEIEPLEVFQVYDWIVRDDAGNVRFHYLVNYVRARYLSGDPRAGDDAAQVRWVTETEIPHLAMHPVPRHTALRLLREAAQPPG